MAVTLSTNVDDKMAQKVRIVAEKENRSVSNILSSALAVFTSLPKDVRDTLLELQSQQNTIDANRLAREMMATVYRLRLEGVTRDLAAERIFGGPDGNVNEIDLMEEATRLTEAASRAKRHP